MILVDTSIWVAHLRGTDRILATFLDEGTALIHPMVIGELACGNLRRRDRDEVLSLLQALPTAAAATDEEALAFIERHRLMGRGIGFVDVHLLASAALTDGARVWTEDARLAAAAARLFLSYDPRP